LKSFEPFVVERDVSATPLLSMVRGVSAEKQEAKANDGCDAISSWTGDDGDKRDRRK
jgi:hypothetical protein